MFLNREELGGVYEICDPLPLPAVASGSIETVGATVVESVGSMGKVFDSSVP